MSSAAPAPRRRAVRHEVPTSESDLAAASAPASAQPPIYLSPPHMGAAERRLLLQAFDENWIAPVGPHLGAFEAEVAATLNVAAAAALSSGTAALHLALHLVGVRAGDTVLMPTLSFAATANAAIYCGATPAFIDCAADAWNIDVTAVAAWLAAAAARGALPAAVVSVDLYGECADNAELERICGAYGVPLVEDAAEAMGARCGTRAAGSFGSLGVLSFNGNKIITTGGGGMLVGSDARLLARARYLATQARDPAPHYQHSEVGFNYRMSNLLAAVGRGQLQHLGARVRARRAIDARYRQALGGLPGITFMPLRERAAWNGWLSCCLVDPLQAGCSAASIHAAMAAAGIETRPLWKPLHLQPAYRAAPRRGGGRSAALFARGLCLPTGSQLSAAQQARVCATFTAALRRGERP